MFQPLYVRQLSLVEREALERGSRSHNREEASRASVILLSSEGRTAAEIGETIGFHPTNVKKWIRKFNTEGLSGITVRKRGPQGGPRPKFTQEQVEQILQLYATPPSSLGYRFKQWSPQKLASAAIDRGIVDGISHVTIRQILKRQEVAGSLVKPGSPSPTARGESFKGVSAEEGAFKAGEVAFAQSRFEEAATHLYAALEEARGTSDEPHVSVLLSRALEELSRYDEAYAAIGKYEEPRLLASLPHRIRAYVRLRTGWVYSFLKNYPKAIASLNDAKRLFLELGDELGLSEADYALGRAYIGINEFRIARDLLVAALNIQKTALDRELQAKIYCQLGTVDYYEGAFTRSKECYLKALELAEASTNSNLIGFILVDLSITLSGREATEQRQALNYIERAIVHLERGGHKDLLALAHNNYGDLLRDFGFWDEALESLKKAIEIARKFSKPNEEAMAHVTMAEILCAKGQFAETETHITKSLELIEGSSDKWQESNALRILASAYRGLLRLDDAFKALRQALQLSTSIGDLHGVSLAMVGLAELHISQGGYDQAREYLELAQGHLKEELYLPVSGMIQRLFGQLKSADGQLAEAKQHIAQSVSIFTTSDMPYDLARSYYEMGLLLKKASDLKGAESNLYQAQDIFDRLGCHPYLSLTRKALASIDLVEDGELALRVAPANDVLLMQRLIEASASRELLVQELAAVIYENYPVDHVIICRGGEEGAFEPLAVKGVSREDAARFCTTLRVSSEDTVSRAAGGYSIRIDGGTSIYIRPREALDVGRLQPLLKQAELGLETCTLRANARGVSIRNYEQRVQTLMPGFIVGSAPMFDVIDKIYKIRTSDVTVLITGESGTGKELVARYAHAQSARARAIFLPFNCTATPKDIIDSQLFGHRRGAFTGATNNYPGIIKAADGGTLFLDEIGDLSLEVQPKLMRFLQEGEIQPLGETKPQRVDVRIVAATNTDLERAVEDGRFREDLFHRLNIIRIHVPPLRDRREEVPVLAGHFLDHFAARSGKQGVTMTQEAIDALTDHDWPGNVRQLRNEIERVVAYAYEGQRVSAEDLSPEVIHPRRHLAGDRSRVALDGHLAPAGLGRATPSFNGGRVRRDGGAEARVKLKEATAALERQLIEEALSRNRNNLSRTAIDLGLSRRGLRLKLGQLGINRD